ncbi:MAG: DNA methylase [Muribaculaceae bacterium]|nr:DNA methylase [Muribaculaceae bacterium]
MRQYIAIDLKSFYASVECVERGLDPLDACLVVADESRTQKTICLAVSPPLKSMGIGGRPRLFEVIEGVRNVNRQRGSRARSYSLKALQADPSLAVDYIVAPPRMALYIDYSARIYQVYLRYVAPEDIHVYSIDEVFIDVTSYLSTYKMTAHQLALTMIRDVLARTGVTATAGIGSNMYLCKIAMDIMAKKMAPDADGVRIAELDEISYRRNLWTHTPITDFWRVGRGMATRLAHYGMLTMGDVARCSLNNEQLLYNLLGVNAELLIDHAWGYEPVEMHHVKSYRPGTRSLSSGQVLHEPYTFEKALVVMLEMADALTLEMVAKGVVTDQLTLTIGYDRESLSNPSIRNSYTGRVGVDYYGRKIPVHSHGTANLERLTSSSRIICKALEELYCKIVNPILLVRRLCVCACRLQSEKSVKAAKAVQLTIFDDPEELRQREADNARRLEKERRSQEAVLKIKSMFGKNAILRGLNYAEGATQRDRNRQIGGHHE